MMRPRHVFPLLVLQLGLATGCGDTAPSSPVRVITENRPGALLSAYVAPDGAAYLVGGETGSGPGLLLRWDGRTTTSIPIGTARAFWWIHGFAADDMWLAGDGGEVHHFDGTSLMKVDAGAPAGATLFGIWGSDPGSDLWTVGGTLDRIGPERVIQRRTAGAWSAVASPADVDDNPTFFKVWGSAADDVWIVGEGGNVLRWDGTTLTKDKSAPKTESYLTVHGCGPSDVTVVGGVGSGVAARFDAAGWRRIDEPGSPDLNGVVCAGGATTVGGYSGYLAGLDGLGSGILFELPIDLRTLGIHGLAASAVGAGSRIIAVGGALDASGSEPRQGFAVELRR